MLFGYLIDSACRIILIGSAVVVSVLILATIILMIGEKKNWW